jgi:ABC-type transport system substrate-binding protein
MATAALEQAEAKKQVQLQTFAAADTHYFFMNTTRRPFNDIRVRQAVNYAIDREKLARLFGKLAQPTENVLPPVYPSYLRHALYPYNIWRARALVRRARARGASVTVYGLTSPAPARAAVSYLIKQLAAIGLSPDPVPKLLPPALYWARVGSRQTHAQIGYAYWAQSFPNPYEWFDLQLGSEQIKTFSNTNYSFANIAPVNAVIQRLAHEPVLDDAVNMQWATLDQLVMQWAPVAPFANVDQLEAFGPLVDLRCRVANAVYGVDYGRVCLNSSSR